MPQSKRHNSPNEKILNAFDLSGNVHLLSGGQNNSWRVGSYVLKYVGTDPSHESNISIQSKIKPTGFRIQTFRVSNKDCYVYDGWICSSFEPGEFHEGREQQKLDASRLLHRSLKEIYISTYTPLNDRWQIAHNVALSRGTFQTDLKPHDLSIITSLLKDIPSPNTYTNQLVHGDLAGNILFHEPLSPLIIDFSPTLATVEYAEAILISDSIAWHNAPLNTLDLLPRNEFYKEMLLRAIIFRLAVAAQISGEDDDTFTKTLDSLRALINEVSFT